MSSPRLLGDDPAVETDDGCDRFVTGWPPERSTLGAFTPRAGDQPMLSMRVVPVDGADLEVSDWGSGEPVIFVQTALIADELKPLATQPMLEGGYRKILYHRRGYAGSSPDDGRASVVRDAGDCRALLSALRVDRAHIVGLSYSAAVGLQLVADSPACVHSLTLVEPPPVHTASAPEFRAANDRLIETRRTRGAKAALDDFLAIVIGLDWRSDVEGHLPGAVAQMERDTATFLDADFPALLAWRFGVAEARRISCPVLHIGGTDSGPWFAEVRELVLSWLPQAADVVIDGADHSLALTHTRAVADAVATFIRDHPITA
jgi:pimeloyl-ACP methyl ester carboxylesterase